MNFNLKWCCPICDHYIFMMKLSELSRVITKTIIRTDWVVKRWIIFRMTIKRLYKTISYAFDKKAKMIVYINILNI
jgi:hypothetical protein